MGRSPAETGSRGEKTEHHPEAAFFLAIVIAIAILYWLFDDENR